MLIFQVQIFLRYSLSKIIEEEDFEHVTSYIWKNPSEFKIKNILPPKFLESGDIFLGLDTIEDLTLLREIYKNLGKNGEYFNANDIIEFLRANNKILQINKNIKRNTI